jgi:serine/threonine-protein kinase
VESTEFVPVAGPGFDPAVLARVESALAEGIGPLARVLVRKAAKTASDIPALCDLLDVALPEAQRAAFRHRLRDLAGPPPAPVVEPAAPRASSPRPATTAPAPKARPERPLSPEVLAEAAERLAIHIGPVAQLLVKRAAKQASGSKDLYERLAAHIDNPRDRQRFVAATEELAEP